MKVNVLDNKMGGVLSMKYEDEKQRLIAYLSMKLSKTTKFMARKCYQLFRGQKTGDIYWKIQNSNLKCEQIIKTWNTS